MKSAYMDYTDSLGRMGIRLKTETGEYHEGGMDI